MPPEAHRTTPEVRSATPRVHLALLFVQITFGGFSVFGKYVLGFVEPMAVAGLRVLFAGPLLLLLALRFEHTIPSRKDWPILALLGFFGVFLNQLLFITGLSFTSAINASILMPSIPVFTLVVAVLLGIERMTWLRALGIGLSVTGALVMLDITHFSFNEDYALGNLLILINCLSYSLFLVLAKPVLLRLPPLTVIARTFIFGGSGIAIVSVPALLRTDFAALPAMTWLGIAYIVLLPTLINYMINTWAIKRSTSTLVAAYTTLQPVAATALAIIFLHEIFGWREVVGFLLIVSGLIWTSKTAAGKS